MNSSSGDAARDPHRLSRSVGLAAAAIGASVVAGWYFDLPLAKAASPGFVSIKANTGLGFILLGLSLLIVANPRSSRTMRILGNALASGAALLGAATCLEYLLNIDLGIDQLLFSESSDAIQTSHSGRMSLAASVMFILLGGALALIDHRALGKLCWPAALASGFIALTALMGYVYGVESLYGIGPYTGVALHSALTFVILAVGVALARPAAGLWFAFDNNLTGSLTRLLVPTAVAAPLMLGWLCLKAGALGLFSETAVALFAFAVAMIGARLFVIWVTAARLGRVDSLRRVAEAALEESERRFRSLVQNTNDVIALVKPDGTFAYVSPAVMRLGGQKPEDLVGKSVFDYMHPEDRDGVSVALKEMLPHPGATGSGEFRWRHVNGHWLHIETISTNLLSEPGVEAIVVNARDISERQALQEQLEQMALYDSLTGLPNRHLFMERLEHALVSAARSGEPIAVLFADLDDFKLVNDSRGHAAGDELLIAVAERMQSCLRPGDTVARFGGDEFVFLVERLSKDEDYIEVVGRLLAQLEKPFQLAGGAYRGSMSVGVALSPANGARELLNRADRALYEAKHAGKNGFRVRPEHETSSGKLEAAKSA
ncbi:MAG: diguanylate cyclase [Dehalococcoidia bacterium]